MLGESELAVEPGAVAATISHDGSICVDFDRPIVTLRPTPGEALRLASALTDFAHECQRRGLS